MTAALPLTAGIALQAAPVTVPESLKREFYLGGTLNSVEGGTATLTSIDAITSFQSPSNVADNYAQRISGIFKPSTTGNYVFFVASDDDSDLFISTDATPANKVKVAHQNTWGNGAEWVSAEGGGKSPGVPDVDRKRSDLFTGNAAGIPLTAGSKYYIEGVMHEGGGGDNFGATFKLVADADPANGDASAFTGPLISFDTTPATFLTTTDPVSVTTDEGSTAKFTVVASTDADLTPSYQWQKDNVDIPNATGATYALVTSVTDTGAKFRCVVKTGTLPGVALPEFTATSAAATLTVIKGELVIGKLKREYFPGKSRGDVENGAGGDPALLELVSDFSAPSGIADNYAQRISGLFIPAVTGDYVFFTASDNDSDLFLSTDSTIGKKQLIAQQPSWGNPREWTTAQGGGNSDGNNVTQKRSDLFSPDNGTTTPFAAGIHLIKGSKYYIEGVMHEGGGGDNFAATFKLFADADPNNGDASAFTGSQIGIVVPHGDITVVTQPTDKTIGEGEAVTFTAKATATGIVPVGYQWRKNDQDIPGATKASYTTPFTTLADNGAKFQVVFTAPGSSVPSTQVTLTVVADTFPPTVVSASGMKHINNDQTPGNVEVEIVLSEPLDASTLVAGNFVLSAGSITAVRQNTNVSGLNSRNKGVVLTTTGLTPGSSYTVTIHNVADAKGNKIVNAVVPVKITKMNWIILGNDNVDHPSDATAISDSGFNLNSGGNGYWNAQDDATFVYEEITGDFDKVARVEYQDPSSQWGRAGLAARESLNSSGDDTGPTPASRSQQVHANPTTRVDGGAVNNSFETNRRLSTGGATSSSNGGGTPLYPNAWIRLRRWSDRISMYRSDDGVTWTQLGTTDFNPEDGSGAPLAAKMLVGFAYGPESGNNDIHNNGLDQSWAAVFRDYSDFQPNKPLGSQSYAIGVNFTDTHNAREFALGPKEVAGVNEIAQANWNSVLGSDSAGATVALKADKKGVVANSTATIEWSGSPNTWASTSLGEEDNGFIGSDRILMSAFLDTGNSTTTTIAVHGIPSDLTAGNGYDLIVYTLGGVPDRGGAMRVTKPDGTTVLKDYVLLQADTNPTAFKEVVGSAPPDKYGIGTYVKFSSLKDNDIVLQATTEVFGLSGTPRAPVNAIQLVPHVNVVVVPPSISISGAGVITYVGTLLGSDTPNGTYAPVANATSPFTPSFTAAQKFYRASN